MLKPLIRRHTPTWNLSFSLFCGTLSHFLSIFSVFVGEIGMEGVCRCRISGCLGFF
ncbi:hypothetical protein Hanom_Chr15g01378131 [Helianthus anomalus]